MLNIICKTIKFLFLPLLPLVVSFIVIVVVVFVFLSSLIGLIINDCGLCHTTAASEVSNEFLTISPTNTVWPY